MPQAYFFDDDGQLWDARTLGFAHSSRTPFNDEKLLHHLMAERGFIAFEESAGAIRMRLVPGAVSPVALSAFCYHLSDRNPLRIAICWLEETWRCRLFGARRDAIRHLLGLLPQSKDRAGDFKSSQRGMHSLDPAGPLAFLAGLWRATRRPISGERAMQVLHDGLDERYVIVQADAAGTMYFRDVGRGFPWLEERWVSRAQGLRMQDQPDYHLGEWAAEAYRDAALGAAPKLDDIDAMTVTPHLGRTRIRYTRLIVPVESGWGRRCVLGAAVINSTIDLHAATP